MNFIMWKNSRLKTFRNIRSRCSPGYIFTLQWAELCLSQWEETLHVIPMIYESRIRFDGILKSLNLRKNKKAFLPFLAKLPNRKNWAINGTSVFYYHYWYLMSQAGLQLCCCSTAFCFRSFGIVYNCHHCGVGYESWWVMNCGKWLGTSQKQVVCL